MRDNLLDIFVGLKVAGINGRGYQILDRKLEELSVKVEENSQETVEWDGVLAVPEVKFEDTGRTQYVPQVKILKRPSDAKPGFTSGEKSPSKHPVKTLQQREAEYAEARLRILGASCSREDDEKEKLNRVAIIGPEGKISCQEESGAIRQPLGPDGTKGFVQRR